MNTVAKMRSTLQSVHNYIYMEGFDPKTLEELFELTENITAEVEKAISLPNRNIDRFEGIDEDAAKAFAEEVLSKSNKEVEPYIDSWTPGQMREFAYWLFENAKKEENQND